MAPPSTALTEAAAGRRDTDDNPSSDATLWNGLDDAFQTILTPPVAAASVPHRATSPPEPLDFTTAPPIANAAAYGAATDQASNEQRRTPSGPAHPTMGEDQHQELLRELGWDSPSRSRGAARRPDSSIGRGREDVPKSSYSIDGADVGAPWSQTGLFSTQFVRDQWLIGVGLKQPDSGSTGKSSAGNGNKSTAPDVHLLEEVSPAGAGRLGLGQMRDVRPTASTPPTKVEQAQGRHASAAPRKTGGLLDQLDAQISHFQGGSKDSTGADRQHTGKRVASNSRHAAGSAASKSTALQSPTEAILAQGRSRRGHSPRSDSDKENRRPPATRHDGEAKAKREGVARTVVCIDSDDDWGDQRVQCRRETPRSTQTNAFEVLLQSPERAKRASPAKSSEGAKSSGSPGRVRFASSSAADSSRHSSPHKVDANQARLDSFAFKAPDQDRSCLDQQKGNRHRSANVAAPCPPQSKPTLASLSPATAAFAVSSQDSNGLRELEEQDWAFGLDEETELQRIEAEIVAEPVIDSDPILFDDDEVLLAWQSRSSQARPIDPLMHNSTRAPPATRPRGRSTSRPTGQPTSVEDEEVGGASQLRIKMITDLSQETQAMYRRQVTGSTSKRKATADDTAASQDSDATRTRKGKGKARQKTWETTWADEDDDTWDTGFSEAYDGIVETEGASLQGRRKRGAGSSSTGESRGKAVGDRGRTKTVGGTRGARTGRGGRGGASGRGTATSAYFKKRSWASKRGRRR